MTKKYLSIGEAAEVLGGFISIAGIRIQHLASDMKSV